MEILMQRQSIIFSGNGRGKTKERHFLICFKTEVCIQEIKEYRKENTSIIVDVTYICTNIPNIYINT